MSRPLWSQVSRHKKGKQYSLGVWATSQAKKSLQSTKSIAQVIMQSGSRCQIRYCNQIQESKPPNKSTLCEINTRSTNHMGLAITLFASMISFIHKGQ
ncbi:hypothetical protein pdam_00006071 [Pocillopora damicornis]|uniref:Uncharacterized protein n=1 Tax=Pocillopora damicornis TaxID=46731 RepID=A0A3M6TSV7_POCDA|nr:hypothetical protein pdam_00006071 [Pocillopora damicornis]